jgi:hypothetical protein
VTKPLTHDALQPAQLSVVVVKVIDRRVRARAVAPPFGALRDRFTALSQES